MTAYLILSIALAVTIVLFFYTLFSSRVKTTDILLSKNSNLSTPLNKAIGMFGGDIYALIQEYAKILQTSCGFIQSRLFKLEAPVYSDYSFIRARYLLFNYADHISDLDAETLKDVNSFKNWAKRFIKNGEALWGWAITDTTK